MLLAARFTMVNVPTKLDSKNRLLIDSIYSSSGPGGGGGEGDVVHKHLLKAHVSLQVDVQCVWVEWIVCVSKLGKEVVYTYVAEA